MFKLLINHVIMCDWVCVSHCDEIILSDVRFDNWIIFINRRMGVIRKQQTLPRLLLFQLGV